ncbi:hypothetical protein [Nocardia miyunensis]|uniref:hypothetical protein n=1 Tax=Nocardia miyunensis TaxID=282684 RepID=UPI000837861F|nr:hypothetical protein [Nocardia miyunensis]
MRITAPRETVSSEAAAPIPAQRAGTAATADLATSAPTIRQTGCRGITASLTGGAADLPSARRDSVSHAENTGGTP